ncbi:DNA primase [Altibacter sp. HG106]|uniref:DNA primase n=1 Tax=Altibacter sp. HG106 TaxID=3023937 RepID=UPI00234FF9C4|nr:DNA primase [Altibacter sp. HG106]MDC7994438.1 DNA primase [Altibacter sp. HG106]
MPYIKKITIDKVFDTADLVEVIGDYVALKKAGATFKGLSPFVEEKTPSFMVSPAKSIWKDFASGKGGNDAVSFLMQHKGISFPEAIETLAKKYAIEIEYDDSDNAKKYAELQEKKEELRPVLEAVIRKYEEAFQELPEDHPAKIEAFKKREYTQEVIDDYRIGYAPGNGFVYNLCKEAGKVDEAKKLGLVGDMHDKWVDRLIYPLVELKGGSLLPVGIAGRRLSEEKKYAKWMNSVDSDLYKKDKFWYGLDKARQSIVKEGEAWLVEGYNDVIAWQRYGILNTVASSGTAISLHQIRMLKKLCDQVVFCFDPDAPGKKAMLKHIPLFLKEGFRVFTVFTKPQLDPDDFVRHWDIKDRMEGLLYRISKMRAFRKDGFEFLMKNSFENKDEVEIYQASSELIEIIAQISDEALRNIYMLWLQKESGIGKVELKKQLKEKLDVKVERSLNDWDGVYYELPTEVKVPLEQLRPVIDRYQLFQANNQIWIQEKNGPPFTFRSVSNFQIEIIQHMQDEKFPMKLVRIRNIHGLERIFDMQSSDMNSPQAFENAVTAHGNFRWKGSRPDHELLKTFLFDGMGTGRKIDVLGWQPEGFWVWNNKISVPNGENIVLDDNGVFEKDGVSYYVPSANQIYRTNAYKYEAQKKVMAIEPKLNFQNFTAQVLKVHRQHGMMGILFSVASIFQDVVVSDLNFFPMLFLFGPASSGKDQLADACQSFFGQPQTAINLEGGVSTIKAQVREFAQFCNMISQLSEYKNGDPKLDGVLKGLWDRRGYKRGNIDSHVGTESIPILSAVLMTGNYAPDQEALISRFIWEFMDKTTFSDQETKEYEQLSDMVKKGISGYTNVFLKYREAVKNNFKFKYREFKNTLQQRRPDAMARMISNLAVLGTFYQMFQNSPEITFPFSFNDMMEHFDKTIDMQMNKLSSASTINRWWDCFLASMRGTLSDQIQHGRDLKVDGDRLYFNFTNCYNKVSRQWYVQYRDAAPAKGVMMDALKKDSSWLETVAACRFSPGRDSKSTSAYVVNLNEIPVQEEIKHAVDFQINENGLFDSSSPATPEKEKNDKKQGGLPF